MIPKSVGKLRYSVRSGQNLVTPTQKLPKNCPQTAQKLPKMFFEYDHPFSWTDLQHADKTEIFNLTVWLSNNLTMFLVQFWSVLKQIGG